MWIGILVILAAVFSIFCAYKDYDWFMENYKARTIVKLFGRDGARIFYIGLGVFLIIVGLICMFTGAI